MDEEKISQLAKSLYASGFAASLWDATEKAKGILGLSDRKIGQMQGSILGTVKKSEIDAKARPPDSDANPLESKISPRRTEIRLYGREQNKAMEETPMTEPVAQEPETEFSLANAAETDDDPLEQGIEVDGNISTEPCLKTNAESRDADVSLDVESRVSLEEAEKSLGEEIPQYPEKPEVPEVPPEQESSEDTQQDAQEISEDQDAAPSDEDSGEPKSDENEENIFMEIDGGTLKDDKE